MNALAYICYYAFLGKKYMVSLDDDMRHMFFQFRVAYTEARLVTWRLVMLINAIKYHVAVYVWTMNQGGRNSSKNACEFAEEWLDAWRKLMDVEVEAWLPNQTPELREGYRIRRQALGKDQARPFWAAVYTDNFDMTFCSSDLFAIGARVWKEMNNEAGIWLQEHVICGTCSDWIGARCVLSAGFATATPSKLAKARRDCELALDNKLTREAYDSNNSFLSHLADIFDWPRDALKDAA